MARTSLPPGFRFYPTDTELIMYHLKRKILGKKFHFEAISEVNIYKFSPWDLPDKSCLNTKDLEWYFFCPRERKYASGDRMKRGTDNGYWKTTGKDRNVMYNDRIVGMVKTLVFHEGSAPRGKRTDWVVYEYRMDDKNLANAGVAQDSYVLYKVFKKNGPGPKNGAQYGAPFKEEEWDSDDDSGVPTGSLPSYDLPPFALAAPENPNSTASKSLIAPVCESGSSLAEAGPSSVQPSCNEVLNGPNDSMVTDMLYPQGTSGWALIKQGLNSAGPSASDGPYSQNDDIAYLLAPFTEDGNSFPNEENCEPGKYGYDSKNVTSPHLDGTDPFNGLEDFNTWAEPGCGGINLSDGDAHNMSMLPQEDMAYLELSDLDAPLDFLLDTGGFGNAPTGNSYAACNPDGSEHTLGGISSTQYCLNEGLSQICYNVNSPGAGAVPPRFNQFPLLPNSSEGSVDATNVYPTGRNTYGNIISQGYSDGFNSSSFSYGQQEQFGDASRDQERAGVPQRNFISRLQQLLVAFPAHPASVAEHLAPSNSAYGGSSIHVKAEVTCRFSAYTKDALSVMLGESTYDYSCWWNLHGAEFCRKAADCSSGSLVFYFGLMLVFKWILMFPLSILFGYHLWKYNSSSRMIACFKSCTKVPVPFNYLNDILSQFSLLSDSSSFCWH